MADSEAFPSAVQGTDLQPLPGRALSLLSVGIWPLFPPSHVRQSTVLRYSGYRAVGHRGIQGM